MRLDRLKVRLADDEERVGKRLQAVGAHADLARALLARHIEDFLALARDVGADAQCQARLADARIADNQDHRARDDAAAEHAVELSRARQEARHVLDLDRSDWLRLLGIREAEAQTALCGLRCDCLLDERIPGPAARTAPHPLGCFVAALLADVDGFLLLWHDATSYDQSAISHFPMLHSAIQRCRKRLSRRMVHRPSQAMDHMAFRMKFCSLAQNPSGRSVFFRTVTPPSSWTLPSLWPCPYPCAQSRAWRRSCAPGSCRRGGNRARAGARRSHPR